MIDTTDLNVHQLRSRMEEAFSAGGSETAMRTTVTSFGYKHGIPLDVDLVFDCRFLPNPHWVEELQPQTGLDEPVSDYVLEQPVTGAFLAPRTFAGADPSVLCAGGESYLTVAFGCTGGRHRSVAIAEKVAEALDKLGPPAIVHRDIDK